MLDHLVWTPAEVVGQHGAPRALSAELPLALVQTPPRAARVGFTWSGRSPDRGLWVLGPRVRERWGWKGALEVASSPTPA